MTGDNTMDYLRRTWADIDLDCIVHNYRELKSRLTPGCRTMAVVKADAYGHGDGYVSRALQREGADWFAVSNINEAISLRRQEVARPILILGCTPPEMAHTLAELGISQTVYSEEYAGELSRAAVEQKAVIDCHVKIDTGMSRIGFFAQHGHEARAAEEIARVCALPGLSCTGVFTHFACADECAGDSRDYTRMQYRSFLDTVELLEKRGITFALRHCCNSAAALAYPEMHLDMVRLGVVLYGLPPSPEYAGMADLRPAMSLYTTITMVKTLEAGIAVSYGRRYVTEHDGQRLASIAIGYADGYRRNFTNKGRVIVRGQYAPITGAVCMDQLMVDVTGIDGARSGDVVTLIGSEGGKSITLDDFAALNGTINYEEACLIGRRVPRVYIQAGREIAAVDYVIATL
ncbi:MULTISPECIES: alanine racemase [Anaerotruncus]|nr:alanine racemase [Anaerotruncus massiliensis (ex Togo et al. 2019)]